MKLVKLNAEDNVVFATEPIEPGETFSLGGTELTCTQKAGLGAKIALCDLPKGSAVKRCAFPIGTTTAAIHTGEVVTAEKLAPVSAPVPLFRVPDRFPEIKTTRSFSGHPRLDGRIGVRNDLWILPLSEETAEFSHDLADLCDTVEFPNIDEVLSCSFPYFPGETDESLRTLTVLMHHPNAAGVLIPVLNEDEPLVKKFRKISEGMDNRRIRIFECSPSKNEIAQGMALVHELAAAALTSPGREFPASELVVGVLCAYPNALSGLTAGPLLGVLADEIIGQGGSVILSCPKLSGAENILSHRCLEGDVFRQARENIIQSQSGSTPVAGGFATPEEEAVFYLEPGGKAPISDVLTGRGPISRSGLNLLAQPEGNPAAVTALAACGAQVILAACGDDAPGCSLIPMVRIASSMDSAERCGGRFDFLAGSLTENKTMPQASRELWNYLLALTASRQKTKSEASRHRGLHLF